MDVVSPEANNVDGTSDAEESASACEGDEGTSPDLLSRLTWDKDLNIYQRMVLAQSQARKINKDSEAKINSKKSGVEFSYKYVTHDDIASEARRILTQNGVLFFPSVDDLKQDGNRTALKVKGVFVNADCPDEKLENIVYGYANDDQDKGPGKAYSYAIKYMLAKTLLLNTSDDIEADNVEHKPATPADRAQKTEEEVKAWRREIFMQIKNTTSYEQLKQIKTDNLPMLNSKIVPEETRKAIVEKIDGRLDELKEVLLQDEAANGS
ncbi:MAG: hypothetical protein DHS20C08_04310 [Rhodomicrobium sp.]|nr:MAG: hypothetical protein DHS20C08_04310 [Rhodomicrobium sp.]